MPQTPHLPEWFLFLGVPWSVWLLILVLMVILALGNQAFDAMRRRRHTRKDDQWPST